MAVVEALMQQVSGNDLQDVVPTTRVGLGRHKQDAGRQIPPLP